MKAYVDFVNLKAPRLVLSADVLREYVRVVMIDVCACFVFTLYSVLIKGKNVSLTINVLIKGIPHTSVSPYMHLIQACKLCNTVNIYTQ